MNRPNLPTAGVGLIALLSCLVGFAVHADDASRKHALAYVQPQGCDKPLFSPVRASFDDDERNLSRYKAYQSCLSTYGKTLMADFMSLSKELKIGGPQEEVNAITEKMKTIVSSLRDLKALSAAATTKLQRAHGTVSADELNHSHQ